MIVLTLFFVFAGLFIQVKSSFKLAEKPKKVKKVKVVKAKVVKVKAAAKPKAAKKAGAKKAAPKKGKPLLFTVVFIL